MRTGVTRRTASGLTGVFGVVTCCLMTGCDGKEDAARQPPPKPAVQASAARQTPLATPATALPKGATEDYARLHQSFQAATLQEPPGDSDNYWLPEMTRTGKSVGKLYEAVVIEWAKVPFVTPQGKRLAYTATIATDLGGIKIELWPEVAPNHVRNFIALARAGYYDNLEFDRAVKRELEDKKGQFFEYLEAGCPMCSGEVNYGSIGYWLKPELSDVKHEEGCVGAWHAEELESAACKFYITLSKAEWMDGSFTLFGKITQGLDVARAIQQKPVIDDGIRDRPIQPVVIRSVTIECREK
jgi:peptidyl-prolyl cis-trans isomerase B (cyclophilin B)